MILASMDSRENRRDRHGMARSGKMIDVIAAGYDGVVQMGRNKQMLHVNGSSFAFNIH
jgi:hypothetical protein